MINPHCYPWNVTFDKLLNCGNGWEITGLRKINYHCLDLLKHIIDNQNNNKYNINDIEQTYAACFQVYTHTTHTQLFFFIF